MSTGKKRGANGFSLPPEASSLILRAVELQGWERVSRDARIVGRTLRRAVEGGTCGRATYERALRYAAKWLTSDRIVFRVTRGGGEP